MTISITRELLFFIFKRLDISWASHIHPTEKLWPFEFHESFRCSFSSVSIYHGPHTYTRDKSYGRLNLPRASVFNFDHLDILCTSIGHSREKLWPFKFLESLCRSFSSVSIYHEPHTYTRVKSYGRLNLLRASVFYFERLDILRDSIWHPSKKLLSFEFAQSFGIQFLASWYITWLNRTTE